MWEGIVAKVVGSLFTDAAKTGVDAAANQVHSHSVRERKKTHQFVLDAIGTSSCLNPYEPLTGFVTLESIDRRVRCVQNESDSLNKYAGDCGIPSLTDGNRLTKLRAILGEMVDEELLVYRPPDKWKLGA